MNRIILILLLSISTSSITSAQDYDHYYIEFHVDGTQYSGVMAIDTRYPKQVLRLSYYQQNSGEYKLIEEQYRLDYLTDMGLFYLDNTLLKDRTRCYNANAYFYSPDYFVFDPDNQTIWTIDANGKLALVYSEFIPLREIDKWKMLFWPETYYNLCGTTRWQNLAANFF